MLRAPVRRLTRQPVAQFSTLPAPVGGLNYRDALSEMKPGDALILDNYFPQTDRVELRRGYVAHVTGFPSSVLSLMEYRGGAVNKLWAATADSIYDATTAGTVGTAAVSSLTNGAWHHTMFATTGGQFLVAVNGADGVRTYDGSAWDSEAITGVDETTFSTVCAHKSRLWFTVTDSATAYHLDVGAIAGAATAFDLGPFLTRGGSLSFIASLSVEDSGAGLDDFLVFVSNQGEMIAYRGTDPTDPTAWAMSGLYRIGRPIHPRAHWRFAGDCLVVTEDGVVSLRGMAQGDRAQAARVSVSNKIDRVLSDLCRAYGSLTGWQGIVHPQGTRAIVNVPTNGSYVQYAMNTLTGAWCRFTGMEARCWGLLAEGLYFGGPNAVYQADTSNADNGGDIEGEVKFAFSDFGKRQPKRFAMVRPSMTVSSNPNASIGLDVDFSDTEPADLVSATTGGGIWDEGLWDAMTWGEAATIVRPWAGANGVGIYAAPRFKTSTRGLDLALNAFDVVFEVQRAAAL